MKPIADKMHYNYDMGLFDAALIIRALECYVMHTENGDAPDAMCAARYLKSLGEWDEAAEIMKGFYKES